MKNKNDKLAIQYRRNPETLENSFFYLSPNNDQWQALCSNEEQLKQEASELLQLKPEIYLILSAAQVFYYRVELPPQQARHARQIIPGLLEEYISSPIEQIAFFSEKLTSNDQFSYFSTYCSEQKELNHALESLKSFGITVHRIHSHQQLLNLASEDPETLHLENEQLQKSEDGQVLALPMEAPLDGSFEDIPKVRTINGNDLTTLSNKQTLFPELCSSLGEGKKYGWLILLVMTLIFCQPLFTYYQASMFREESLALRLDNETQFKQRFPDVKRVVNIKTQIRNLLRQEELKQDSVFLYLLAQYTAEVANSPNYQLQGLKFNGSNQELHLDVRARDITEFEQLLSRLLQRKISARLSSVNESQNGARGKLIISGL